MAEYPAIETIGKQFAQAKPGQLLPWYWTISASVTAAVNLRYFSTPSSDAILITGFNASAYNGLVYVRLSDITTDWTWTTAPFMAAGPVFGQFTANSNNGAYLPVQPLPIGYVLRPGAKMRFDILNMQRIDVGTIIYSFVGVRLRGKD